MLTAQDRQNFNLYRQRIRELISDLEATEQNTKFYWDFGTIVLLVDPERDDYGGIMDEYDNYRHPIKEGFCGYAGCAIGTAMVRWPEDLYLHHFIEGEISEEDLFKKVMAWFGMDQNTATKIFYNYNGNYEKLDTRVTAYDVAERLHKYLDTMRPE